jgi:hypothetical protein
MENDTSDTKPADNGKEDRARDRLEVFNTIFLAIATLAVAWCSYQNNLWNGIQTFKLADSNKLNRLALQKTLQAGQIFQIDEAILSDFMDVVLKKNNDGIELILKGVRPEMSTILRKWLQLRSSGDSTVPIHPMVMPEYKEMIGKNNLESEKLRDQADQLYKEGDRANTITDQYSMFTVLFSLVMFLSAIATKATRFRISFTLVLISGIICIASLVLLILHMPLAPK